MILILVGAVPQLARGVSGPTDAARRRLPGEGSDRRRSPSAADAVACREV